MSAIVRRPQLEDDQKFALMKFRKTVEDILGPDDDDYFLLRWLRARKWNIEAAEKMLRSAHRNKQTWIGTNWKEPQVLKEYLPYGLIGCDNEGSPTILVPFSGLDLYGILHCTSASEFVRKTVLLLEYFSKVGFEQSKTKGVLARQFVVICDMTDFNIKQYAWRPAAELIISLVKNYELHYPETLKICYIINAPKVFSVAFNFIKKFMDDYTRSKICIFNHGSAKWQKLLFEHLDPKIFPKYYGGELTDEDGDPKCKSKICWGGKVPEEMYTKRDDKNNNANYIDTVIEKGKKLKIELNCDIAGSVLSWDFSTIDHDIRFGIKSVDNKTGESHSEVPLTRVISNEMDEAGYITCRGGTKYVVVFDNSYSYLRSKKLKYCVEITPPLEELEKGADDINDQIENLQIK